MCVGEQMIRAEITVRRYDRSSCLICQDEGWHSASFIHCWWKYERDLRHLALAQKRESRAKKALNDKWHVILSHFWPCCSLTCSTTATNIFHGEPSADWLATEGSVTCRKTCADVRKTSSPSFLIANIQDQLTFLRFMDRLPESILCRRLHWDARSWELLECMSWL